MTDDERERRWLEYEARQRASECASLSVHWDGIYEFSHDGTAYIARRVHGSGPDIREADLFAFREAVRLDYCQSAPAVPWPDPSSPAVRNTPSCLHAASPSSRSSPASHKACTFYCCQASHI